jgi:Xaa-Pro aminopeptidase
MFSLGADGLAFETIVASGANGAKPHAVPSDNKIKSGDFVTIDFGARKDNYDSDMTRTVAVGEITKEMENIYNTVLFAHEKGRDALKPGVSCKEADAAARKVIEDAGYGEYFTHSLGHGVGIEIHESPRLSKTSTDILKVGDIVTVEPGIYIEGFCGVRIENMYVITRDGYENLTVSDKKLIKL